MMFRNYHKSIELLESTINQEHRSYMEARTQDRSFFLERAKHLFSRLGNPERNFRLIHVAGTSGKGSTTAMIYETMVAAGMDVGMYLSPYVTTAVENIHARGRLIDPEEFTIHVDAVMKVVREIRDQEPKYSPSYAEIFFAVAMIYFKNIGCEWLVLEAGCGGRFDKTNIIPTPAISVLTNIGLDHTKVLGETKQEIAYHKAGIIKPATYVYSTETSPAVREIFDTEARRHHVDIQYIKPTKLFKTQMPGKHQQKNAALCQAVAQHLGIKNEHIEQGIYAARLPARIEVMQKKPLVIIDGAHSPAKIRALVQTLDDFRPWTKLHLLFAAKDSKEPADLLAPLVPYCDEATITSFKLPGLTSHNPQATANVLHQLNPALKANIIEEPKKALSHCLKKINDADFLLITGSLYLSGELRQHWISEADILKNRTIFPT